MDIKRYVEVIGAAIKREDVYALVLSPPEIFELHIVLVAFLRHPVIVEDEGDFKEALKEILRRLETGLQKMGFTDEELIAWHSDHG